MKRIILIGLVFLLFYTRFVNLGWGLPYPMHPDERNMAVAVQQLSCPNYSLSPNPYSLKDCFNPHFFAYGQFPLYLAATGIYVYHFIVGISSQATFLESTLALRTISALSSILLVFVLFKIIGVFIPILNIKNQISKLQSKNEIFEFSFVILIFTFLFLIFQPYSIQFSHFGTTESLLMLLYSLIIYYSLKLLSPNPYSLTPLLLLGAFSGLALGTKTSSILFLGMPLMVIFIKELAGGRIEGAQQRGQTATPIRQLARLEHWWEVLNSDGVCRSIIKLIFSLFLYLFISSFFFILSSPHSFLNWTDFVSSMNYESSIGLGTYVAFYTRQFVGTTPLLFQFQSILPYVLGWPQLILSVLGLIFLPSKVWKIINSVLLLILQVARVKGTRQHAQTTTPIRHLVSLEYWRGKLRVTESAKMFDLLRFALLLSFLPPSFFFAKWTRFIAPSFPLFSLFAILFLIYVGELFILKIKDQKSRLQIKNQNFSFLSVILIFTFLFLIFPGIAYLSVYTSPDVRFTASEWIYKNIPAGSKILSESANVIDLPIPTNPYSLPPIPSYQINSFNFYDLDASADLQLALSYALKQADYIIVPSRRVFKNHSPYSLTPNPYPLLNKYYSGLFSGSLGFEQVAEFSSYPCIEIPVLSSMFRVPFVDEQAEETWTVFDHPVIRIYKRSPKSEGQKQQSELDFSEYKTIDFRLSSFDFRLLVADTPEKWEKGLMYVKNKQDIGGADGMIFIFPDSQKRTFWNKNTLSQLTLYWINDVKVIGESTLPSIIDSKEVVTVSSPSMANIVIEVLQHD